MVLRDGGCRGRMHAGDPLHEQHAPVGRVGQPAMPRRSRERARRVARVTRWCYDLRRTMIEPRRPSFSGRFPRTAVYSLAVALAGGCSRSQAPAPSSNELVYVSDETGGFVVVVDPGPAQVVARIPVGKRPRGLKLSR